MIFQETSRIPKQIHTVWVGKQAFPRLVQRCFLSWKKFAPDYSVQIWNEENSPMEHPYVKAMYTQKKWAFVSDYIRFWVLYNKGGIYLDTDMEMLKPIDDLVGDQVFFGRTSSDGFISCGIIGAVPGHFFLKKILDWYDADVAYSTKNTSPKIVTECFLQLTPEEQALVKIYPPEFFYPCNVGESCSKDKLVQAYTNHHWAESWVSWRWLRRLLRKTGIWSFLKKVL